MHWNEEIFSRLNLEYSLPVFLALVIAVIAPSAKNYDDENRRKYKKIQFIVFLGAIIGAKVTALMGNKFWPVVPLNSWDDFLQDGRSVTGGLIGGFLAGEMAKFLFDYRLPPNNRFSIALAFSLATGRIGCFLAGCCRGLPHEGFLSVTYSDGIPRYPAPLCEMFFHLGMAALLIGMYRKKFWEGRFFAFYLIIYGVFRFFTEFMRDTRKTQFFNLSVYQFLSLAMILIGLFSFIRWTIKANQQQPALPISPELQT